MVDEQVPAGSWEAADWIARRHVWVRELVARIVPGGTTSENWLEEPTAAVVGVETHRHEWHEYEPAHPEPTDESR